MKTFEVELILDELERMCDIAKGVLQHERSLCKDHLDIHGFYSSSIAKMQFPNMCKFGECQNLSVAYEKRAHLDVSEYEKEK